MLDIGWLELILIGVVALIVVGPKDLPGLFRTLGRFVGKARGMARDFQTAMEQAADESGVTDVTKDLNDMGNFGLKSGSEQAAKWADSYDSSVKNTEKTIAKQKTTTKKATTKKVSKKTVEKVGGTKKAATKKVSSVKPKPKTVKKQAGSKSVTAKKTASKTNKATIKS